MGALGVGGCLWPILTPPPLSRGHFGFFFSGQRPEIFLEIRWPQAEIFLKIWHQNGQKNMIFCADFEKKIKNLPSLFVVEAIFCLRGWFLGVKVYPTHPGRRPGKIFFGVHFQEGLT